MASWPRFICVVGIDGSGKSTICRELVDAAARQGHRYRYVWASNQPILLGLARPISRRLLFRGKGMFDDYRAYRQRKNGLAQRSFLYAVYAAMHTIDYALWLLVRVSIPRMFGARLVVDRYAYDVALNLGLLRGHPFDRTKGIADRYLRWFGSPDVVVWIDVPARTAIRRKSDIPSVEYLEERRQHYAKLADTYGFHRVDGSARLQQVLDHTLMCLASAGEGHRQQTP